MHLHGISVFMSLAGCFVLAVLLSGCVTTQEERRNETMRQEYAQASLRQETDALKERVRALEAAQEVLAGEMRTLQGSLTGELAGLRTALGQVDRNLKAMEAAQQRSRDELITQLSKQMADILKEQAQRTAPAQRARTGEHVVAAGETLSRIAQQYGVTVDALIRANQLSDPNTVRVGQRLVIP